MIATPFVFTRTDVHSFSWTRACVTTLAVAAASTAYAGPVAAEERSCEFRMTSQGRLDGTATNAPLSLVLDELSRTAGIEVVGMSATDQSRISFAFRGIAVPEALLRILSGRSYTISAKRYGEAVRVVRVVIDGLPEAVTAGSLATASDHHRFE
jgi:hypothetical protein